MPLLSPGKSTPVLLPNPKRSIQRASRSRPSASASVIAPTFDERDRICATRHRLRAPFLGIVDHPVRHLDRVRQRERRAWVDDPLLERTRDGDDLERRTGLVRVRDGAVAPASTAGGRTRSRRKPGSTAMARMPPVRGSITIAVAALGAPGRPRLPQHLLDLSLQSLVEAHVDVLAFPRRARLDDVEHPPERVAHDRLARRHGPTGHPSYCSSSPARPSLSSPA